MLKLSFISVFIFTAVGYAQAITSSSPPHMDLDMTSAEYRALLQQRPNSKWEANDPEAADLAKWEKIGEKTMQWVDLVNQARTPDQKISLSSQATQGGHSPDEAVIYSYKLIQQHWAVLQNLMPASLRDVIFGDVPMTAHIPVTDREFTEWLTQADHNYQDSVRYDMNRAWKPAFIQRARSDVRGYLYLRDVADLDSKLQNWTQLSMAQQQKFSSALVQICKNGSYIDCDAALNSAITSKKLVDFKNSYFAKAAAHYQSYFQIPEKRQDVTWNSANPKVFEIPFANPHNDTVLHYLQDNIQDEWKWNGWQLKLNFVESDDENTTHVVFEPGVTPHVNQIAGSIITMDQNAPLSEYNVQWTIRHEYGHVLGFPDCYLEFYDESIEAFVSYQLDVTNLMCSRRGHFQQTHFEELKRVYFAQ